LRIEVIIYVFTLYSPCAVVFYGEYDGKRQREISTALYIVCLTAPVISTLTHSLTLYY